jgi:hypothetical protein
VILGQQYTFAHAASAGPPILLGNTKEKPDEVCYPRPGRLGVAALTIALAAGPAASTQKPDQHGDQQAVTTSAAPSPADPVPVGFADWTEVYAFQARLNAGRQGECHHRGTVSPFSGLIPRGRSFGKNSA